MAGVNIQIFEVYIERLRDWWDELLWRSSPECREMIHARLQEHDEAIKNDINKPKRVPIDIPQKEIIKPRYKNI